jgi:hypothetical protein
VPPRTEELSGAIAVEHVLDRAQERGPGRDRVGEHRVDVGHPHHEGHRRAADAGGGEHAALGPLVGEHHGRVADGKFRVTDPTVGSGDAELLAGAEHVGVESDRGVGTVDAEVGHHRRVGHRGTSWCGSMGMVGSMGSAFRCGRVR